MSAAYFKALVHGLIRQHFYDEPEITHEVRSTPGGGCERGVGGQFLKEQIFAEKPPDYPDENWPPSDSSDYAGPLTAAPMLAH